MGCTHRRVNSNTKTLIFTGLCHCYNPYVNYARSYTQNTEKTNSSALFFAKKNQNLLLQCSSGLNWNSFSFSDLNPIR